MSTSGITGTLQFWKIFYLTRHIDKHDYIVFQLNNP